MPTRQPTHTAMPSPSLTPPATSTPTRTLTRTPMPAPRVVASYPIEGDLAISPFLPIVLVFDHPMDPASVAAGMSVSPTVEGQVVWESDRKMLFTPDTPWSEDTYELRLAPSVADAVGAPLGEPFMLRFGADGKGAPVPVLMYHRLVELDEGAGESDRTWTVSPSAFAQQMEWLASQRWSSITPAQLADYFQGTPLPPKPIIISMDDGYKEVATVAWPVFQRTGLRPVLFIIPTHCGYKAYLDWPDLEALVADGVAIGSHTYDHVDLRKASDADLQHQLGDSRTVLEDKLGVRVNAFCYPYGSYDSRVMDALAAHGYTTAFTLSKDVYQSPAQPYQLQRLLITYATTLEEFAELLP
ncbi:MAG: polysaccharide deacetylase family protein [Anaerolineae bacterium]